jgi:alpha-L-fucosidase
VALQNSSSDWSFLERYRAENKILHSKSDKYRIVFIGDSIIAGWNEQPFFLDNKNFINRGINGQTTAQILHRFPADVIELKPKCVVVLVGTNDIAQNAGPISLAQIQVNFISMIELAKTNAIKIVFCSILPVSSYYWNPKINPLEKIEALNRFLNSNSDSLNVFYLDFHSLLSYRNSINIKYFADGVHPNNLGYSVLSQAFWERLTEFL